MQRAGKIPMNKICATAGCRNITSERHCKACSNVLDRKAKESAKRRARASSERYSDKYKTFYSTTAWKKLRALKLSKDPLCENCLDNGFVKAGHDIDHIVELKDDYTRRLDMSNLMTLCRPCHMAKTARERRERLSSLPNR